MDYCDKSKKEIIAELQQLKKDYSLLKEKYTKSDKVNRLSREIIYGSDTIFKALFEQTVGYCMILDPNVDNGIPMIIDANISACETHNYSREELIGRPVSDINDSESKKHVKERTEQIMAGESYTYESKHIRKDGTSFPVVVYAKNIQLEDGISVIFTHEYDISKDKAAEQKLIEAKEIAEKKALELEEQKDLFKIMLNTITDGIIITNSDRVVKLANNGITNTFGYKPNEIIGKSARELFSSFDEYKRTTELLDNNYSDPDSFSLANLIHKNGKEFKGETYCKKLYDHAGEYIGNIGILRDVTERETFINDLKIAKTKAEESARLKTAFLQNLSHEIRTPLNSICGFSDILNEPSINDKKRDKYVSIIQNSSDQLLSIVSDILTISSLETNQESVNIESVNINQVIIDLLTIFKKQSNNKISLYATRQLCNKQAFIYTDKTKLTQILSNLISNAIKFTHKGFIQFGYTFKNGNLEFFVKDTGIGVKKEYQQTIFERFRQADTSNHKLYGGTGLGLAISKGFVELLGGDIWLDSIEDKGTNIFFSLPYKPVEVVKESVQINTYDNFDRKIVLIAEDEYYNFLIAKEMLAKYKFNILHAKNGQEAIEIFKKNRNIDLVLMDIKMPLLDGYSAAKHIKKIDPFIPIIAQSAYSEGSNIEKFNDVFDEYILKPISKDSLIKKVSYCLANVTNNVSYC